MATEQITVSILGREYRLSCEPAERDNLLAAVAHVDAGMQAIRDQGRIAGTERIAVFAALNIAGALLASRAATVPAVAVDRSDAADVAGGSMVPATAPATDPGTAPCDPVADPEIVRRMQSINALLDTALANQEPLF